MDVPVTSHLQAQTYKVLIMLLEPEVNKALAQELQVLNSCPFQLLTSCVTLGESLNHLGLFHDLLFEVVVGQKGMTLRI